MSEPVHNLVHRMVLEPDGVTFRGRREATRVQPRISRLKRQLVPAHDAQNGPDALWIADMYRAVIEHPEWIPDDWERRLDLRARQ